MGGLIFSHLKIDGISMLPCGPAFSIPIMDVEVAVCVEDGMDVGVHFGVEDGVNVGVPVGLNDGVDVGDADGLENLLDVGVHLEWRYIHLQEKIRIAFNRPEQMHHSYKCMVAFFRHLEQSNMDLTQCKWKLHI